VGGRRGGEEGGGGGLGRGNPGYGVSMTTDKFSGYRGGGGGRRDDWTRGGRSLAISSREVVKTRQ